MCTTLPFRGGGTASDLSWSPFKVALRPIVVALEPPTAGQWQAKRQRGGDGIMARKLCVKTRPGVRASLLPLSGHRT